MTYYRAILFLGLTIGAAPVAGLPLIWIKRLELVAGLVLVLLAILMYQQHHTRKGNSRSTESGKQSAPTAAKESTAPADTITTPRRMTTSPSPLAQQLTTHV